jgi:diguanylate cyclase (GGDEF)-like protein
VDSRGAPLIPVKRRTILCIDDDPTLHQLVKGMVRAFRARDFAYEAALSFDDGLAKLTSGTHAVCLLDYRLDHDDGLFLLKEAQRLAPHRTPVIVLTADDTDATNNAALEAGALDYLVKAELTPRLLERAIRYACKLDQTLSDLRRQATHDELTGLLNRRETYRILTDECERSSRTGRPFALALMDVDEFKRVNDAHGHPVGDVVLRHVARVLGSQVRRVDKFARFGGEEFALIMPETGRDEAVKAMERLRRLLEESGCEVDGVAEPVRVTMSAGVAVGPGHGTTANALIDAADRALYLAKKAGRNRVLAFSAHP